MRNEICSGTRNIEHTRQEHHVSARGTTFTMACVYVCGVCARLHMRMCTIFNHMHSNHLQADHLPGLETDMCVQKVFNLKKLIFVNKNGTAQQNFGGKNRQFERLTAHPGSLPGGTVDAVTYPRANHASAPATRPSEVACPCSARHQPLF